MENHHKHFLYHSIVMENITNIPYITILRKKTITTFLILPYCDGKPSQQILYNHTVMQNHHKHFLFYHIVMGNHHKVFLYNHIVMQNHHKHFLFYHFVTSHTFLAPTILWLGTITSIACMTILYNVFYKIDSDYTEIIAHLV